MNDLKLIRTCRTPPNLRGCRITADGEGVNITITYGGAASYWTADLPAKSFEREAILETVRGALEVALIGHDIVSFLKE